MPSSASSSSPSSSTSLPPKALLLPPINFPVLNHKSSIDLPGTFQSIKQPSHQISPEFILSGTSVLSSGTANISNIISSSSSSSSNSEFPFQPFKLSATSSPYIPSFMGTSSSFLPTLVDSNPPELFISQPTVQMPEVNISSVDTNTSNYVDQGKQKLIANNRQTVSAVEVPSQPKGQITILKRSTTASTTSTEDVPLTLSKPLSVKSPEYNSLFKDFESSTTRPTIKKQSTTPPAATLPSSDILKTYLESEISKQICDSIEKVLFPRIEASIKSLTDDLSKFQISCTKKCTYFNLFISFFLR